MGNYVERKDDILYSTEDENDLKLEYIHEYITFENTMTEQIKSFEISSSTTIPIQSCIITVIPTSIFSIDPLSIEVKNGTEIHNIDIKYNPYVLLLYYYINRM